MICSVHTLGISGIMGSHITVECYLSNGLPAFDIVGLPDAAVKEARERVRAAAKTFLSMPIRGAAPGAQITAHEGLRPQTKFLSQYS